MRTDDSRPPVAAVHGDVLGTGEEPAADRAGDLTGLHHLQQVHRPVLLAYVARLTKGDTHWAEDIVQETMVRAWRHPESRNAEGKWNRAWLYTVARRITIDHLRAAEVRPSEYFDGRIDARGGISPDLERLLDSREVRAALASLPERLSSVLIEIYFRERSIAETAVILGVPPGTVKSRTFYALRALREALQERGFLGEDGAPDERSPGS